MTTAAPGDALGSYFPYTSADGTAIESYFVAPEQQPAPAVLMLRGIAGPDSGYTSMADQLARSGYAALVHQWLVRGTDPADADLLADIAAAITFLQSRSDVDAARIAVFGYCKGGGQALLAAAAMPAIRAVVAFHGFSRRPDGADATHADPLTVVPQLSIPVLLLHGEDDQLSPLPSMRELAQALAARPAFSELHTYAGADHGFAVSTHKGFRAEAAGDSFKRGVAFLNQNLRSAS
jgi:carboxymethylenebutenolidase